MHLERGGRAVEGDARSPKDRRRRRRRPARRAAAVPNSADIFRAIGTFVAGNPATAEKVKTTFLFKLSSPDSAWTIDLVDAAGHGAPRAPSARRRARSSISDADFMAMATGQADAMKLFSTGKLKISGDVMASQKLGFLKKLTPEMVLAETQEAHRRRGAAAAAAAARRRRRLRADASTTCSR